MARARHRRGETRDARRTNAYRRVSLEDVSTLSPVSDAWLEEVFKHFALSPERREEVKRYLALLEAAVRIRGQSYELDDLKNSWEALVSVQDSEREERSRAFLEVLDRLHFFTREQLHAAMESSITQSQMTPSQRQTFSLIEDSLYRNYLANPLAYSQIRNFCEAGEYSRYFLDHLDEVGSTADPVRKAIRIGDYSIEEALGFARTDRGIKKLLEKHFFSPEMIDLAWLRGKKVLDVGSGSGEFVMDLRDAGVDAGGLDIRQSLEHLESGFFVEAPADAIPLPDNSLDAAYSNMGPFYKSSETGEAVDYLAEMVRVVKNGGRIAIYPLDVESLDGLLRHFPELRERRRTKGSAENYGGIAVEFDVVKNPRLRLLKKLLRL